MRLLLMEDELMLRESIEEYLCSLGYEVDCFESSDEAFDAIFSRKYDLLLFDVNVPGEWDGFSLLNELQKEQVNIPTIFVTSMSSSDAMLQGYDTGCCDYIKKPFDLIELKLRIQQALKSNCFQSPSSRIELAEGCWYDTVNMVLQRGGEKVNLSKTESEILELFLMHRKQVVEMDTLFERIWEGYVDPANARVQINNLKRKLPEGLIVNKRGVGYMLDC